MSVHLSKYTKQIWRCGRCGYCGGCSFDDNCPSFFVLRWASATAKGKMLIARSILDGRMKYSQGLMKNVFACTTCGACRAKCDIIAGLDLTKIIEAMRADIIESETAPNSQHKRFGIHIGKEHNPYGEQHKDRLVWLPSDVKLPEKAETVYFVGCTSSYRQKELAKATVEVFKTLGVNFTIMRDEWCCASPLLRTGQWETDWISTKKIAQHNIEEAKQAGAKRIVTTCAGCYRTWKRDYTDEYGRILETSHEFEILHTTELLEQFVKSGEVEFNKEIKMRITYHDPCHLGRHIGLFDAPRNVLKAIPGIQLIEMPKTRENSWCCGAGGGVKAGYPDWALEIARQRIEEAERIGVDAIVSACPFCWRNLSDAINTYGSKMKMYDVIELVNHAMKNLPGTNKHDVNTNRSIETTKICRSNIVETKQRRTL